MTMIRIVLTEDEFGELVAGKEVSKPGSMISICLDRNADFKKLCHFIQKVADVLRRNPE